MNDFTLTVAIDSPPETVFEFIAEPRNMALWYDAVERTVMISSALGQGATFEMMRALPGGRAVNQVEVTEYEPYRRLTIESRTGPTPFRYAYTINPNGHGTLVVLAGRISPAGLPGPAAHLGSLATELFKRGMAQNLHQLKRLLEDAIIRAE